MSIPKRADNDWRFRGILHSQCPKCHWCGIVTIEPKNLAVNTYPDNMATLDHIKSRVECHSQQGHRSEKNKVLSCLKCNRERDHAFLKKLTSRTSKWYDRITVPPELSEAFGT